MSPLEAKSSETSLLAAALEYAKHNVPVFPCKPRGKEPLTPHGFKDATTDPSRIREYWGRWPDANIGIPTGPVSGLFVVDCDASRHRWASFD